MPATLKYWDPNQVQLFLKDLTTRLGGASAWAALGPRLRRAFITEAIFDVCYQGHMPTKEAIGELFDTLTKEGDAQASRVIFS
jgi:hypothetical protein